MRKKTLAAQNKDLPLAMRRWHEDRTKYIDVIVSSGKIRREFFVRCRDLNIDPVSVALKAGISKHTFVLKYINESEPQCTKGFPQKKFINMLEMVGIEIKVLTLMKPLEKIRVELIEKGIIKDE